MEYPVQTGNCDRNTKSRIYRVFYYFAGEMGLANPGDQREPGGHLKFVTDERFLEPGGYGGHRRAVILTSWIVRRITDYKNITKEIVLVLCEAVDSALNI